MRIPFLGVKSCLQYDGALRDALDFTVWRKNFSKHVHDTMRSMFMNGDDVRFCGDGTHFSPGDIIASTVSSGRTKIYLRFGVLPFGERSVQVCFLLFLPFH